jgi:phenylacetate-coenzyme A ligase PaaK-like adenylate-forming protein
MGEFQKYWNEERETMSPAKRERFILERVKKQLEYVYARTPFYRALYDREGVRPDSIRSLQEFTERVPIVTKQMLRESQERLPPFGDYLGVEPLEVRHIHGTSGTTGMPTMFGISDADWDFMSEATAMLQWAAGMRPNDIVQISFPMSLFLGGWGMLGGAQKIGARIMPIGGGETERQIRLMYHLGSTVLCATPSYCLYLLEAARKAGRDTNRSPLRLGIFGGEPGAGIPQVKRLMEQGWGIKAIDFGNSAEVHPCSNMECEHRTGMHVWNDLVYTEVVSKDDPNTRLPMGSRGAVVYTALWRNSQPMIRYWPGDETLMIDEPCACGRTYPRLPLGVIGRLDDLLIIRGVNVYPSTIEQALRDVPGIGVEFRIYTTRRAGSITDARIEAESEEVEQAPIRQTAERKLRSATGIRIPVTLVAPGTFSRAALKARRVVETVVD